MCLKIEHLSQKDTENTRDKTRRTEISRVKKETDVTRNAFLPELK